MKQKLPVILLLISTLSLGILLVVQSNQAKERTLSAESRHSKEVNQFQGQVSDLDTKLKKSAEEIAGRENEITSLGGQLSTVNQEKGRVDQELQTTAKDRDQTKAELASTKTNLIAAQNDLVQTKTNLIAAQKDLVQTKANVAAVEQKLAEQIQRHTAALNVHENVAKELDAKKKELTEAGKKQEEDRARIAKLETSLDQVNQQVGGLKTQLVTVEKAIDDTKKKLASSEGDATYLRRELTRMEDEKAILERQLNDLEYVRAQYKKLQEEFVVKQRIDWITRRVGIYAKEADKPGVEAMLARYAEQQKTATPAAASKKPSRLSVELRDDGSVNIQPIDTGTPKPAPQTPEPPKAPAVPEAPKATVPSAPAVPAVPTPAVPAPAVPAPAPKTEPKPADVKGVVTPSPVPSTPKK